MFHKSAEAAEILVVRAWHCCPERIRAGVVEQFSDIITSCARRQK